MEEQNNYEDLVLDYLSRLESYEYELVTMREEIQVQSEQLEVTNTYLGYACGFLLFFVTVTLCVFGYKLIRLFV